MHSAQQPANTQRNRGGRIRLSLNSVADRPLERAHGLTSRGVCGIEDVGRAIARLAGHILSSIGECIRNATGLSLGVGKRVVEIRRSG